MCIERQRGWYSVLEILSDDTNDVREVAAGLTLSQALELKNSNPSYIIVHKLLEKEVAGKSQHPL